MSKLLARIMLAIFMLPAAAIVYLIALLAADKLRQNHRLFASSQDFMWFAGGTVSWAFIGIWWLLLWRKAVQWTSWRKLMTCGAVAGAVIVGAIAWAAASWIGDEVGYFVFTAVTPLVWLPLTVLIWRETPAERAGRVDGVADAVVCPNCGYNLTGLSTARCPECGSSFTLNDLYAGQPGKAAAELDRG